MFLLIYRRKALNNGFDGSLPLSLASLASLCQAQSIVGDEQLLIEQFCSSDQLKPQALTFVTHEKLLSDTDDEVAYIIKPEWQDKVKLGLVHDNPAQAFRLILTAIYHNQNHYQAMIAESAQISPSATIGQQVSIGHHVVIGDHAVIGDGCVIGHGVIIENHVSIGQQTELDHAVIIHDHCVIGDHCMIASGTIIGGQGFGFNFEGGNWYPVPQIGRVIIGNQVHIGNNTCIDRGAINDTVIADNVIIDNLVHIAHNVHIGAHSALAGCVGIAGSTTIGQHCMFGGQVGIAGHINICDGVQVNGGSKILKAIKQPGAYAGSLGIMPARKWNRIAIYFKKLDTLFKREKKRE